MVNTKRLVHLWVRVVHCDPQKKAEFKKILFKEPGWGFVDMEDDESEIHVPWRCKMLVKTR